MNAVMPMPEPALSVLGLRVRAVRESRGLKQDELADLCGYKRSWVQGLEAGEIRMPSWTRLERLATALNVSAEYLAYGRGGIEHEKTTIEVPRPLSPLEIGQGQRFLGLPQYVREQLLAIADTLRRQVPDDQQGDQHEGDQPPGRTG